MKLNKMEFKIRKITYTNGVIFYYPMVKKRFCGWYYIREISNKLKITKSKMWIFIYTKRQAREIINHYKTGNYKKEPIIKDILID